MTDDATKLMEEAEGATPATAPPSPPRVPQASYIAIEACKGEKCDCGRVFLVLCHGSDRTSPFAEVVITQGLIAPLVLQLLDASSLSADGLEQLAEEVAELAEMRRLGKVAQPVRRH